MERIEVMRCAICGAEGAKPVITIDGTADNACGVCLECLKRIKIGVVSPEAKVCRTFKAAQK